MLTVFPPSNPFLTPSFHPVSPFTTVMQTAWRERNPEARVRLAKEALERSADCAAAYILLAEEEGSTILEVERILKQALRIAEANFRKTVIYRDSNSPQESLHSESESQ